MYTAVSLKFSAVISFQNAMGIHGALVGHLGPKVKNFEGFKFDAGSDHV
jgi:hypothetical protein